MEADRVVFVSSESGACSGYVIGPRLVLTSAHGVPDTGSPVEVAALSDGRVCAAEVIWRGTAGGRDDASLIRVSDPAWSPRRGSMRFGRLVTNEPAQPAAAWGFPRWQQNPGHPLKEWQPAGRLNPGSGYGADRYVLTLDGSPPGGDNPWAGMSGAALHCGDLLTGLIVADQPQGSHGHLVAVPIYVLSEDEEWRRAVTLEGGPEVLLEPVELFDLAEPVTAAGGTPASLLLARNHVVNFRSRLELMNRLDIWSDGSRFSALVLHGPGGQGKTRVAAELERRLARQRWATLWLSNRPSDQDLKVLGKVTVPLLIIVDYAETSTLQAATAARECAQVSGETPVRMLLLARSAGDWWDGLRAADAQVEELLADARVEHLPELEVETIGRVNAYREAVTDLALALSQLPGEQDRDWSKITFELRDQARDLGEGVSALTLHMTALADLLDKAAPRSASPAEWPVEERLIGHERRYWVRAAEQDKPLRHVSDETLLDALAAAMLFMPNDRAGGDRLLRAMPAVDSPDARASLRRLFARLYPPSDDRPWAALQPDRLLERFVAGRLSRDPLLADPLIDEATPAQIERVLAVYSRAAAGSAQLSGHLTQLCLRHQNRLVLPAIHMAARVEVPEPLINALRVVGELAPLGTLMLMANSLPSSSHCLAGWAVELSQRIVTELRRPAAANSVQDLAQLARELDRLSSRLAQTGQSAAALEANDEACVLYRRLAEKRPETHLADLACCLNNRSERLAEFNQLTEALQAAQEATDICLRLAARRPREHAAEYARSLMNVGRRHQKLGNLTEALRHTQRAVSIHRQMASDCPEEHLASLAMSLHYLSGQLAAHGLLEKALTAVREAVAIRQRLADDSPDAHLADLAKSMEDLSDRQAEAGHASESILSSETAVVIFERFTAEQPGTYMSDLARALHRLAVRRFDAGHTVGALSAALTSVGAYRRLSTAQAVPHRLEFASALKNLADLTHVIGLPGAADLAAEALDMFRILATPHRDAYLPQLAACLNNLAVIWLADGLNVKGLGVVREAVTLRRRLAAKQPDLHGQELVNSLTVLAVAEAENGNQEAADAALREARSLNDSIAHPQHQQHLPDTRFTDVEVKLAAIRAATARGRYVGRTTPALASLRQMLEQPSHRLDIPVQRNSHNTKETDGDRTRRSRVGNPR